MYIYFFYSYYRLFILDNEDNKESVSGGLVRSAWGQYSKSDIVLEENDRKKINYQ